ncbi:MAG: EAL domain-containing protein [Sulfurimonas sp.]|nr:EAL domain-containing protein [Sulfurimonas sp.]
MIKIKLLGKDINMNKLTSKLDASYQREIKKSLLIIFLLAVVLSGISLFPSFGIDILTINYLPIHTILETIAVVTSSLIFAVGWNTYRAKISVNIVFLCILFFGVAIFDVSHILSYEGMPYYITENSVEKAIDFWLAGRLLAAMALMIFALFHISHRSRLSNRYFLLTMVFLFILCVHWIVFFHQDWIPATFIEGSGLTAFKSAAEYFIIALNLTTALILWRRMSRIQSYDVVSLFTAVTIMAMSEFFFTLYGEVTDTYNLMGHLYKLIAYAYVYKAIFVTTVQSPYIELEKSKSELIESEQTLRESQNIAGLGSYIFDFTTLDWSASEILIQVFGVKEKALYSYDDWIDIIHPDDREMMIKYFRDEVMAQGNSFDKEYRITRKNDNAVRWMHGLGKLRYKDDGTLKEMIGTIQDITERKETLETLIKLSLAVEQSPNSIVITDLDGNIEYVNAKFSAVTGYSLKEVLGKNPRILQSSKTPIETYDVMWEALQKGNTWEGELINKRKDGQIYIESAIISPVKATSGKITNYVAIKEDITEKKSAQEHIDNLAHFDQLTGLANRILFGEHAKYLLEHSKRTQTSVAIMFLDLDHFKDINDSLGHSIGDEVLKQTAQRLKNALRSEDMVSRLGGDEFILIFPDTDITQAINIATKIIEAVSGVNLIEEYELTLTPSIGIAIYPNDGMDLETLLKNADTAMYRVKEEGRNGYSFFTQQMQENLSRNLDIVNGLRYALERDEFELYYQPQLSVDGKNIIGAEALLRWKHPLFGMVSPGEFIPIAEESGQIIKIGDWVLKTAIKQMKKWQDEGLQDMIVAVNLSAVQFKQANFSEHILEILQSVGLAHEYLELELTEAVTMNDPKAVISVMDKLHEQNIRMSIDDFGTGYSSLSYLKKFKIYKLKIDQSFIRDIHSDQDDRAIVTTIIHMAKSLGIQTIAEGVETLEQLEFLRANGCNEIQGYYYSKPLTSSDFAAFVRSRG